MGSVGAGGARGGGLELEFQLEFDSVEVVEFVLGGAGGLLVVLFVRPSRGRLAGARRRQTSVGEEGALLE